MNDTANETFYTLDEYLTMYGSTWALDYLSLYPLTIISVLGLCLNTLSLLVFRSDEFNIPLYAYLRVYSITNILQSFVSIFNFVYSTYRIVAWSNSYGAHVYYNYVSIPVTSLIYFYASLIGLIVLLDRITCFQTNLRTIFRLSPYKACVLAFAICFIINLPCFFAFAPASQQVHLGQNSTFIIWFSSTSAFAESTLGQALTLASFALQDLLVSLVEIILNVFSIYLFKRHLNRKKKLISSNMLFSLANLASTRTMNDSPVAVYHKNTDSISKSDQRATLMAISMCVASIGQHVVMFTCAIYPYFRLDVITFVLYFLANLSLPLKCLLDFFIFLGFNRNFRRVCFRFLKIHSNA